MRPTFSPGDALVTRQVSATSLRPGTILIYRPPGQSYRLAHRIVSITWQGESARVVTKGDANPTTDAPVQIGREGGPVVIATIPHLGSALAWANPGRPRGRTLVVGLIGLLLTAGAMRRSLRAGSLCNCRSCLEPGTANDTDIPELRS